MSMFGMLDTAASGMRTHRVWLNAVSDNIANISTFRPMDEAAYQPRYVDAQALPGANGQYNGANGGVGVRQILFGDPEGRIIYSPDSPLADENGLVRAPDTDLGDQMTALMMAQRSYQSNSTVVLRAKDMYQQAMQIGRG